MISFVHDVQNFMIKSNVHLTDFSKKCHLSHSCAIDTMREHTGWVPTRNVVIFIYDQ
jgi:hypothetical protein